MGYMVKRETMMSTYARSSFLYKHKYTIITSLFIIHRKIIVINIMMDEIHTCAVRINFSLNVSLLLLFLCKIALIHFHRDFYQLT